MWSSRYSSWNNFDPGTHTSGRRYGQMYNHASMYVAKNIVPASNVVIIGFWIRNGYVGANTPWRVDLYGSTNNGAQVRLTHSNEAGGAKLRLYRGPGTTLLDESTMPLIFTNEWARIEMKITVHDTTGAYEVKLNGRTVFSDTNVDTQQQAGNDIGRVVFWSANTGGYYIRLMDVYICDDSGSQCNDFLGDIIIELLRPTSAGNYSQWTPNAGSNYDRVDDTTRDEDTTYNESDTEGEIDTFNVTTLSDYGFGDILAVSPVIECQRKHDVSREVVPLARISATDYPIAGDGRATHVHTYSTQYGQNNVLRNRFWELNPADSLAWEVSDINNAEFGYKLTEDNA